MAKDNWLNLVGFHIRPGQCAWDLHVSLANDPKCVEHQSVRSFIVGMMLLVYWTLVALDSA